MQRYSQKNEIQAEITKIYPLYTKIIIYEYSFCTKILNVQKQQMFIQLPTPSASWIWAEEATNLSAFEYLPRAEQGAPGSVKAFKLYVKK